MYIDDNNCVNNGAVLGDQGRDRKCGGHHVEADIKQEEVKTAEPAEAQPQENTESTAARQEWPQEKAESTAPQQAWPQGNAETAAYYQGWQQGNAQNAAYYQGWQQPNAGGAAYAQGYAGDAAGGQVRPGSQVHVHEVQGSVEIAGREPHSHRFATVTSEARPLANSNHYHDLRFRTDFYEDHYHEGWGRTGGAVQVGDRHVHFLESVTTQNDGHVHRYRVGTMFEDPTEE